MGGAVRMGLLKSVYYIAMITAFVQRGMVWALGCLGQLKPNC